MVTLKDIQAARANAKGVVSKTPLVPARNVNWKKGSLSYKLENLQETGSFKERGAYYKLSRLKKEGKTKAIIAASAGNHAQAVARHGVALGFDVTIFMPQQTPLNKVVATQRWGAKVRLQGHSFDEATSIARTVSTDQGAPFIHAFDDLDILTGQGTCGLEILEDLPDLDVVYIPVGGGGLASGSAIAIKEQKPKCKIIGVQAENYPHTFRALKGIEEIPSKGFNPPTIADGISMKSAGQVTAPILKKYLDDIVTVTESEMADAVLHLLQFSKVLSEGAGAAGLAAIMAEKAPVVSGRGVVVVSGGNIDVNVIARIIEKGLMKTGRLLRISVIVPDRPGGLKNLTALLAEMKANILQIQHERSSDLVSLYETGTELLIETRGPDHKEEIILALQNNRYSIEIRP